MGSMTKNEPEAQAVRQYRYLLRTAPTEALEGANAEALESVSESDREAVLRGVQDGLVAGARLAPSDITKGAHLLTLGERRTPGAFLRAQVNSAKDLARMHGAQTGVGAGGAGF